MLQDAFDDRIDKSGEQVTIGVVVSLVGLGGMLSALAIDPSVLAFATADPSEERALRVVPWLDPERGRAGLRIALSL